jgi:hypothetical protein
LGAGAIAPHYLADIDVARFAHQPNSTVTAAHCVEITSLTEKVDDFHQVRLRDTETLRDIVDRRQLTVVKADLNEDSQRKIGMKGKSHYLLHQAAPSKITGISKYIFSRATTLTSHTESEMQFSMLFENAVNANVTSSAQ